MSLIDKITFLARRKAVSPPGTIPSSTAAFVAPTASFTLSFFSLSSISVAAPTLICATPPESFAKRSCNFSLSKSESVVLIWFFKSSTLLFINFLSPLPPIILVLSLSAQTFSA